MKLNISILTLATLANIANGLSTVANTRQVAFPLKTEQNKDLSVRLLKYAFQELVETTEIFVQNSPAQFQDSSCLVPALGPGTELQFQQNSPSYMFPNWSTEFVLNVNANENSDFGWICVKFFEQKELFEDYVDTSSLYEAVVNHYNSAPPHPGFPAGSAELSNSPQMDQLFGQQEFPMDELQDNGFLVLDNGPQSTAAGHVLLDQFLNFKTDQSSNVRTDSVHFLNRNEAMSCGFQEVRYSE